MNKIALITVLLALGACSHNDNKPVPESVTVHVDEKMELIGEGTRKAQRECGMNAKAAVFDHVVEDDDSYDGLSAKYLCIE